MNRNGYHRTEESELTVIRKAKNMSAYIFQVTQSAPKKFRFSLVAKLQNLSLDVISNLYKANDTFIPKQELATAVYTERVTKRLDFSFAALTSLKELDHIVTLAREMTCITPKQHEQMALHIYDVRNLLGAWIKSEKRRYPS